MTVGTWPQKSGRAEIDVAKSSSHQLSQNEIGGDIPILASAKARNWWRHEYRGSGKP